MDSLTLNKTPNTPSRFTPPLETSTGPALFSSVAQFDKEQPVENTHQELEPTPGPIGHSRKARMFRKFLELNLAPSPKMDPETDTGNPPPPKYFYHTQADVEVSDEPVFERDPDSVTRPGIQYYSPHPDRSYFKLATPHQPTYDKLLHLMKVLRRFNKAAIKTFRNCTMAVELYPYHTLRVNLDNFNNAIGWKINFATFCLHTDFVFANHTPTKAKGNTSENKEVVFKSLSKDIERSLTPVVSALRALNIDPEPFIERIDEFPIWEALGFSFCETYKKKLVREEIQVLLNTFNDAADSQDVLSELIHSNSETSYHTQADCESQTGIKSVGEQSMTELIMSANFSDDEEEQEPSWSDAQQPTIEQEWKAFSWDWLKKEKVETTIWERICSFFHSIKSAPGRAMQYLAGKVGYIKSLFTDLVDVLTSMKTANTVMQYAMDFKMHMKLFGLIVLYVVGYSLDMLDIFSLLAVLYSEWAFANTKLKYVASALSMAFTIYDLYTTNVFVVQAKGEFENCPILLALVSIVAAASLGSAACLANSSWLTGTMRQVDLISKSWNGLMNISDKISSLINAALGYIGLERYGFSPDLNQAVPEDIERLAKRLTAWARSDIKDKMAQSKQLCNEIYQTMADFNLLVLKYKQYPAIAQQLQRIAPTILSLYNSANLNDPRGQHPRKEPVTLFLYGAAGSGKSRLVYPLTAALMSSAGMFEGLTKEQKKEKLASNVFSRKSGHEFWDGYNSQFCTVIDDAFQEKDVVGTPNKDWMDVINMSNMFPYPLNMAHVEKKGTVMFNSEFVMLTSNLKKLTPETLVCPDAVQRRIGFAFEVSLRDDLYVPGSRRLKPEHAGKPIEFGWYEFRCLDLSTGRSSEEKLTYNQVVGLLRADMERKRAYQSTDLDDSIDQEQILNTLFENNYHVQGNAHSSPTADECHIAITELLVEKAIDNIKIESLVDSEERRDQWKMINSRMDVVLHEDPQLMMEMANEVERVTDVLENKDLHEMISYLCDRQTLVPVHLYLLRDKPTILKRVKQMFVKISDPITDFVLWTWERAKAFSSFAISNWLPVLSSILAILGIFLPKTQIGRKILNEAKGSFKNAKDKLSAKFKPDERVEQQKELKKQWLNHFWDNQEGQSMNLDDVAARADAEWEVFYENLTEEQKNLLLYQSGKFRTPPKRVSKTPQFITQAWQNNNAESISAKAVQNLRSICRGTMKAQHFFMIYKYTFVINKHVVRLLTQQTGPCTVYLPGATAGTEVEFSKIHFRDVNYNGRPLDLMIGSLPYQLFPQAPDLRQHLIKMSDIDQLAFKTATLHVPTSSGVNTRTGRITKVFEAEVLDIFSHQDITSTYIDVAISSSRGDCGGFYCTDSKDARRLIGIHGAGSDFANSGLCVPVFQEFFYELQSSEEQVVNSSILQQGAGNVQVLGIKEPVFSSTQSKIIKTKAFGKVIESPNIPAQLAKPLTPDGPMLKAVEKQFGPVKLIDFKTLSTARRDYELVFQELTPERMQVCSFEEATKGIEASDYYKPINRSRSAGYPWCTTTKLPGKTKWFGDNEWDYNEHTAELENKINDDIEQMKHGHIQEYIFLDTLKDETRPIEKVKAGKTRCFAAAPMDFIIVFRMFFLDFLVYMMKHRIENESAVGIRAQSEEWYTLHRHLGKKGRRVIAGDFSNYDGSLHPAILWSVFDVINGFYTSFGQTKEEENVRRCLWNNIVNSYHLCGYIFYQLNHSQPSGNPSTAILNSMYNSIACRYVWYCIYPESKSFADYVSMIAYGDDNVLNVSKDAPEFDQERMAYEFEKIGMTYTDEHKTGLSVDRTLEEVSFLKRGFRYDSRYHHSFSPLELTSILDCFNWIHKTDQESGVMLQNATAAFVELAQHDEQTFHQYSRIISSVMRSVYGINLVPNKYKEYRTSIASGRAIEEHPELLWA